MRIALVSLDQHWRDKKINLDICVGYLEEIRLKKCALAIFPEMTLTGFYIGDTTDAEPEGNSWTIEQFQQLAIRYQIGIVFGVILRKDITCFNAMITLNSSGKILSQYNKIHPFALAGEHEYNSSGTERVVTSFESAKILNSICYDLRFPELFSTSSKDINIIINIANLPEKRIEQWYALLRARAIEGLVYMIAVNRSGLDGNNISYSKSSAIFSPAGEMLVLVMNNVLLDIFELDIDEITRYRKKFPFLQDRKTELYQTWF